jgi:hypothetical protein
MLFFSLECTKVVTKKTKKKVEEKKKIFFDLKLKQKEWEY